jgi:hypothetical protein
VSWCFFMNDAELIALASAVSFEAALYSAVNRDRLNSGFALAYPDTSANYDLLISELNRRGVLVC